LPPTAANAATTAASAIVMTASATANPIISARPPLPRPVHLGRPAATVGTPMTTGETGLPGNPATGRSAVTEQPMAPLPTVGQGGSANAPVGGSQPVYENTTEEEADGFAPALEPNPVDDLLSEAL